METPEFICPACKRGPVEGHEPLCVQVPMYPVEAAQQMHAISCAMEDAKPWVMRHKTYFVAH